ncbi:MAG: acylphosphatase [Burkholderiales bacterium]|nr:acylphosphatase [Burkholderiales bacterium]
MSLVRNRVTISGHVQGVFFRDRTQRQAAARGVTGWVRNLPDGRVEAVFEGDERAVQQVVTWCHQGPPNAYVTHVETHAETPTGEFTGFSIRY